VIRLSVPWIAQLKDRFDDLNKLEAGQPLEGALGAIFGAQRQLELLFNETFYKDYFRVCRVPGDRLYELLQTFVNQLGNEDKKFSEIEIQALRAAVERFKNVFIADLEVLPVFLVSKKDNYDINLLIDKGNQLFPQSLGDKVPEALPDAFEAGKALAFALPTACGFHVFRVTEAVLRRFWDQASGGKERPSLQTMGNFAAVMEKEKIGDAKIVESIKQMTKLHRNPLIHPDYILSEEEAIGILGMARSVIAPMLQVLPDAPLTTGVSGALAAASAQAP
jgi:hypothetical protein